MTMELVDGRKGEPHIDSTDMGILHQALYGRGSYVLDWGQSLACAMSDANHAVVGTGCGMIQGLCFTVTGAETVQIDSGTQSAKRNDIIVAHYHRDTSGVETVNLEVITGTETSGTPADPTIPSGIILEGATDAYMPLWRIPITGITPGTPVKLFESLPSLRDSVTRSVSWRPPFANATVTIARTGGLVTVNGFVDVWQKSLGWHDASYLPSETIPAGYRPCVDGAVIAVHTTNHAGDQVVIEVRRDGSLGMRGSTENLMHTAVVGSWPTTDPMPA